MSRALLVAAFAAVSMAQTPPTWSMVNTPQDTSTRTQATTLYSEYGTGSALLVGGRDSDSRTLTSTATVSRTTGSNVNVVTAASTFQPLAQATTVYIGQTGRNSIGSLDDVRTFVLGGFNGTTLTNNVAIFDGNGNTFTPRVVPATTGNQGQPQPRFGAAAAYLTRCNMSDVNNPKPCIVMFGGQGATSLLNDVWALWVTETPIRWELIMQDSATPTNGQPPRRVNAVGAASADGGTMFVYGGSTSTGPTSDMFALAPAGFPEATQQEMTNVALFTRAREGPGTLGYWGDAGPGIAVDGREDRLAFDTYPFGCTHTVDNVNVHWWQTQLNTTMNIDAVRIVPRFDGWGWRTRSYQLFTHTSDPNNGPPPTAVQAPNARVANTDVTGSGLPNLANAPVMIYFSNPRPTRNFWIHLPDLGYARALSLCEVQIFVKRPWIWRNLGGSANVALNKPARQTSLLTDWGGGDPSRAVDGGTTNNYDATKTCTHTAGVSPGTEQFWQVDLGGVFTISHIRLWPRTECCTNRNDRVVVYAGNSRNNYMFDQRVFGPATINSDAAIPFTTAVAPQSGSYKQMNAGGTRARYVTVAKSPQHTGWDDSIIALCELEVWADRLRNQPDARRDFASAIFRGSLVIFGGTDRNGFRMDDMRYFDLNTREWMPAFDPLGTNPSARAFTSLAVLSPDHMLLHGGSTNGDVSSDMAILTFATCPNIDKTTGVDTVRCTGGGNVCVFRCLAGFVDRNAGRPVICRDNGLVEGFLPPCVSTQAATQPLSMTTVVNTLTNTSVTVNWAAPGNLGYYFGVQGAAALKGYRVRATPREFFEDFSANKFIDESKWRILAQTTDTQNVFYFRNGKLIMDGGPGSDTWQNYNVDDVNGNTVGNWAVRNMFVLYRDWPATQVNPAGEWAMEVEMEAISMCGDSLASIGLVDTGYQPAGKPEIVVFFGIRYTDWGANGATATVVMESNGGRISRTFPALSTRIFLRIERVLNEERDLEGNWVFRFLYKYDAGARWSRIYAVLTRRHVMGVGWNPTTQRLQGPGMQPQNLRPYLGIKSWNGNDYARAVTSFRFLKITPSLATIRPGNTLLLGPSATTGVISGLTPGATYDVTVEALTDAGYGAPATSSVALGSLPTSTAVVWGTRLASQGQQSFASTIATQWGAIAAGNDGNWLGTLHHSTCGGDSNKDWWGVDLGVDYAAVKSIRLRNRCEAEWAAVRLRHASFYIGDDVRGAFTTNQHAPLIRYDLYFSGQAPGWMHGDWGIFNWPPTTIWQQKATGPNFALQYFAHSTAAYNTDADYCQARIPTPGEGRYFYLANNVGDCLNFPELQVYTADSCPARDPVTSNGGSVIQDNTGGKSCGANSPFGTTCAHVCSNGDSIQSGTPQVRCNGERWTGGFAARVACAPTCPELEPAPYTDKLIHVIVDENFQAGMVANDFRFERLSTLNPVFSPLLNVWSFADGTAQAVGRLGLPEEPTLVFVVDKIRAMDQYSVFTVSANFVTEDRAGIIFRVIDAKNFYRVYLDIPSGVHVAEAVVNGVPRLMADAVLPLNPSANQLLTVSVNGFNFNVSVNGRLLMQTSDRAFVQGYAGVYAQSTARFTRFQFRKEVRTCAGAQNGERCETICQAGLTSQGSPTSRTCNGNVWSQNNIPTRCTLDPPAFPSAIISVRENSARNALVGSALVAQSSSSLFPVQFDLVKTYIMPGYVDYGSNMLFSVDFCTGQVKVRQSNALDFEFISQYTLTVRAYISGFTDAFTDRNVTVNIINVDEPPFIIPTTIFYDENTTINSVIGNIQWWDPENDTMAWTTDVGDARFAVDAGTGAVRVVAQPVNTTTGFMTMGTSPVSPLSFEGGKGRAALSVSIRQTRGDLSLTASGDVILEPIDKNDPPFFSPPNPFVILREEDTLAVQTFGQGGGTPFLVSTLTVTDEDQPWQWNSSVTLTQVDPVLCGVTNPAELPTAWTPGTPLAWAAGNELFSITNDGRLTMIRKPAVSYGQADGNGNPIWTPTLLTDRQMFVRAQYKVCVTASDAHGASTTNTITVLLWARLANTPIIRDINPKTFPITGAKVNITGENFLSGTVFTVTASYTNGVQTYNATGCVVSSDVSILCNTVQGFGGNMVWTVRLNNRAIASEVPIIASYIQPFVRAISNHQNMPTAGRQVIIQGTNFGPSKTPVSIFYGPASNPTRYQCTATTVSPTSIFCNAAGNGGGRNLVWSLVIGGQTAFDNTSTTWSYAAPLITGISVPTGVTYTPFSLSTLGGQQLIITGQNFGAMTQGPTLEVTYGVANSSFPRLLTLSCNRDSASQHTRLICLTAPGAGTNYAVSIAVEGVFADAGAFSLSGNRDGVQFNGLTYLPPRITRISGPGAEKGSTEGGQRIIVEGSGFGPGILGGQDDPIDSLIYGPNKDTLIYTATGCMHSPSSPDRQIECLSAPGVGRNLVYRLTIAGQENNNTDNVFGFGSYAPPSVAGFTGDGATYAYTRGGQSVVISGRNFGPADSYTNGLLAVSYGEELQTAIKNETSGAVVIGNITFTAASCSITVPHIELTCTTAEGAGQNLVWDVVVAGQKSATPTTNYAPPEITSITYKIGGAPVLDANVDGGDWVVLTGSFFGPKDYARGRSLVQSITYGILGTEYAAKEGEWVVVDHEHIEVKLGPGSGNGLVFRVSVADQRSSSGPDAYFNYATPQILLLDPYRPDTFSDPKTPTICTVVARNLPLLDPLSKLSLSYGNVNPRILSPALPRGATALAAARNTEGMLAGSINISFPLPTFGGGLGVGVSVLVTPAGSAAVSQSSPVDATSAIDYLEPIIHDIIVTKARFADAQTDPESDLIDCPFNKNGLGGGSDFSCSDTSAIYEMSIVGKHLTSSRTDWNDGVTRKLELLIRNETYIGEGEVWSDNVQAQDGTPITAKYLLVYTWEHTRIKVFYKRQQRADQSTVVGGVLRMRIGSTAYYGPALQEVVREFKEQNPEITDIVGNLVDFPTAGGDIDSPIILTMENLNAATDLKAFVGGRAANILKFENGVHSVLRTPSEIVAWLGNPLSNNNGVWTIRVQVPEGQGKEQKVQIFKITNDGPTGSNDGFTVSYIPPVMTGVQVVRNGVELPRQPININTQVEVPTDGRSAVVRIFGTNLGVEPVILVGYTGTSISGSNVRVCTHDNSLPKHTCYEFNAPEGEGDGLQFKFDNGDEKFPNGYRLQLDAGDQRTVDIPFKYEKPTTSRVVSSSLQANGALNYPTKGGVLISLFGNNYGSTPFGEVTSIKIEFGKETDSADWNECLDVLRISHSLINCTLPVGSGKGLSVRVTVAGQTQSTVNVFSYNAPSIVNVTVVDALTLSPRDDTVSTSADGFVNPVAHGRTVGGDLMIITGTDFGVRNPVHCAFFTWSYRRPDAARPLEWIHTCNGYENFLGEGEISSSNVIEWDHERIVISTPPGLGYKDIELSIRGNTLGFAQEDAGLWRFVYAAPTLTALYRRDIPDMTRDEPETKWDTDNRELATAFGDNFGTAFAGNSTYRSEVFPAGAVPLEVAHTLPMAVMAVVFHRECITNARTLGSPLGRPDGVTVPIQTTIDSEDRSIADCIRLTSHAADSFHSDQRIVFETGGGIGRNRTAYIVVIDGPHRIFSNKIEFDYKAPLLEYFAPDTVRMTGTTSELRAIGKYFGDDQKRVSQRWTEAEQQLVMEVGGIRSSCLTTEREAKGGRISLVCTLDERFMPAGMRNVSVTAAGQTGRKEEYEFSALTVVCAVGYYGRVNETCLPCPAQSDDPMQRGADCAGYLEKVEDFESRFSYPTPRKGWYNLNSSDTYTKRVTNNPSMMPACPPGFQAVNPQDATDLRDVCIVPCDPPESCLGDNWCAEGYTSKAPYWRCGSCDKGYYRRAGECIKCPDSPAALFIGFILLVIVVAAIGFALNRKQINIAVISIGVDFFQVLGIFGQARIKWPPIVKELLHVLSAFNLNIEIVAPECLIPDINYKQKFWFIMILPLCIAGLFGLNYVVILAYKAIIQGQPKKTWHTHKPALVSSCLVLLYLLYLYLTRTIFDVFNCGPTFPPDGKNYLQVVPYEECGVAGGVQLTLMPYAIAGLAVYVAGYPVFIGWTIFNNRELVMEDQLLRAKGTGNDKLTNPRAYDFRMTYGRSYFQFKPDWCLWILAIVIRKFCIAVTAVVFGKNSSFQMAACLLIMFLAYAAQVQIRPYMSPGDFDEVIKSHTESSMTSAIHARLRSSLAGIETRGRKKARKNLVNFEGKVDRAAVFGILTGFFFNYNTVEAIMSFCAVIVCLMAIMYQANELNTYYPESKDSVTAVLMIIVLWAIVYFFTVFATEITILYNEDSRAKQLARSARSARGKEKKSGTDESDDMARRHNRMGGDVELNVGNVENTTNPMFVNQGSNGQSGIISSSDVAETILSQKDAPPVDLWRVFQSSYVELNDQVKSLQDQLLAAKKAAQNAANGVEDNGGPRAARAGARTEFAPKSAGAETSGSVNPLRASSSKGLSLAAARKSTRKVTTADEE